MRDLKKLISEIANNLREALNHTEDLKCKKKKSIYEYEEEQSQSCGHM